MCKLRAVTAALFLLTAMLGNAAAQTRSLYERLGGKNAIKAVVDDLAARVIVDPRINKKFARSNVDRLKFNLVEFICSETGGPCKYTGRDMKTAHKNMGVTEGEFNALVENLIASLDKFNVGANEKNELLKILASTKPQIVEVKSQETGTPLPASFKPAPPLKATKPVANVGQPDNKK
ncbi:MAG: group 1 truncated hemoglobin [Chloracidobacterium sp.]|nr:group 1 truncated hemoglobin [Chloracidobacterium sp.]